MKKSLLILTAVFFTIFLVLSLADSKGEYAAEQIIWKTNQQLARANQSPEAIPDREFESIIKNYERVIKEFPASKVVPRAYLSIGETYLVKRSYDTARKKLSEVLAQYPKYTLIAVEAVSTIGRSYELQDDVENAVKTYQKLTKDYPLTDTGLRAPFYIASYYERLKEPLKAKMAYADATIYYIDMAANNAGSEIGYKSLKMLTDCYTAQQKWPEAIETMGRILVKYPTAQITASLIRPINTIALVKLQDPDAAITIYRTFLEKNPNHSLSKTMRQTIDYLNDYKKKKQTPPKKT